MEGCRKLAVKMITTNGIGERGTSVTDVGFTCICFQLPLATDMAAILFQR